LHLGGRPIDLHTPKTAPGARLSQDDRAAVVCPEAPGPLPRRTARGREIRSNKARETTREGHPPQDMRRLI
jgi:hypothetical protein